MNVYEIVTNKLLEQLENGKIPWQRPWKTEGKALNYITRKEYQGINRLLLSGGEYLTFKQVQDKKGKVKKGAHSNIVVFWKQTEIEDENGEKKIIPILRYYTVFSIHDCEGIESKLPPIDTFNTNPIETGDNLINEYFEREKIELRTDNINQAFYSPAGDYINMPKIKQFENSEEYYSTFFHEMAHSTGHEKRLNRLKKIAAKGDTNYSKEELTAEITAAYLCENCGFDTAKTIKNSAAYIQSWSKALKSDPRLSILAAGAAEKATEFILKTNI